ncbi:ABC transporter permease [Microterricola viridarii]|uniref:Putative ABC transport system permease protein n=1 Tax=Microterricola viridarii TaxID=412690 RepID=A0A1H1LFK8_9MICO|nr:ABC transporter permease [Microterricola viridarii]SDR73102.1 putative ABC transport system permease protein [Microterricola viridarii]
MNPLDVLKSAVSNTFRNKVRTLLTVIAIFIGAFTLTITSAIGAGVSSYIDAQISSIGGDSMLTVSSAPDAAPAGDGPTPYDPDKQSTASGMSLLSEDDVTAIAAVDGIADVQPAVMLSPDFIEFDGNGRFEIAVNPMAGIATIDLAAGAQLENGAGQNQILLPASYVDGLGFADAESAIGQPVTLAISDYEGTQHTVEAVVQGVQNDSLFAAGAGLNADLRDGLDALRQTGKPAAVPSGYVMAIAYLADGTTPAQLDDIQAALTEQGLLGMTVADQIGAIQDVINGIIGVLNAFAVIALIAAGFGIINTLLMSVQERTREIGLMKAMGMGGGKIFALFSFEAIFIGLLGSALGAAVAIGLGSGISSALSATVLSGLPGLTIMLFTPASIATIIGIVMAIAFLAGTLPARRAAKQNPIDALRYE